MKRKSLYAYAAIFVAVAVMFIIIVVDYSTISSQSQQLNFYKKQNEALTNVIFSQYREDMEAARGAWIRANQADYIALQNKGIGVMADTLETDDFTAVFDLQDPSYNRVNTIQGDAAPGEVIVYLGQYYLENMTRASGWTASYTVNMTTHAVSGFTSSVARDSALEYYNVALAPAIHEKLGVASGSVASQSQRTIDCSYLPDTRCWLDVTEHKYTLKYGSVTLYLLIKTYVDADDGSVVSVDVSKPYYESATDLYY